MSIDTPAVTNDAMEPFEEAMQPSEASSPDTASAPVRRAKSTMPAWHANYEPPNRGPHNPWWLLWKIYGALKLYKFEWIPIPHHWGSIKVATSENHKKLWSLGHRAGGTYVTESVAGGVGKTTLTTWHAAEMQMHTDLAALLVDTDSGSKGKPSLRYQITRNGDQLTFEEVQKLILEGHWVPSHSELQERLPRHEESGVRLLSTDNTITCSEHQTIRMLHVLSPEYDATFVDTTPGVKETLTKGARSTASIINCPGLYENQELGHDIRTARSNMNENDDEFERRITEGSLFITVSGIPRREFNRRTQYALAEKFGVPASQVLLLPMDKHIASKGPVQRAAVSKRYLYALSVSMLDQATMNAQLKKPLTPPMPVTKENTSRQIKRLAAKLVLLCDSPEQAAAEALRVNRSGTKTE